MSTLDQVAETAAARRKAHFSKGGTLAAWIGRAIKQLTKRQKAKKRGSRQSKKTLQELQDVQPS